MLTQYQVGAGSSVYNTVADYIYDGNSNRLQQIDSSGTTPITTTYTNDNAGLSQVLVSDDGTTTTLNLFGLDLIQQDDGSQTRTLLVDGLGSARVEMVGNVVESTTTFEPYGKLLVQNGSSGTTYGYTGEQYDVATSLVYLRARYYNPNLKVFMSRDPFSGWATLPASQNGYSYVHNNPVNLTDYSGKFPTILIGAGAGAIIGTVGYLGTVALSGGQLDFNDWIIVAGTGAVSGALIGSGVGALAFIGAGGGFGGLGYLLGSMATGSEFCSSAFLIAAGTGAVAATAAIYTPLGASISGVAFIGASANTAQYVLTEKIAYGRVPSTSGIVTSAIVGGVAGAVGGKFNLPRSATTFDNLNPNYVMSEGFAKQAYNRRVTQTILKNFLRSFTSTWISNAPTNANQQNLTPLVFPN